MKTKIVSLLGFFILAGLLTFTVIVDTSEGIILPPNGTDCPACGRNLDKIEICHIPPGNPDQAHEICISQDAWPAHQEEHGDYCAPCGEQVPGSPGLPDDAGLE